LVESILSMLERSSIEQYAAQVKALLGRPDLSQVLPQVRVPTLCLCGREDAWTSPQTHRDMASSTAHGEFVEVADCGHMSPMERPAAVTAALREWLTKIPG
jgi:pimeloyl-ACP methyl ester carboxylesterase